MGPELSHLVAGFRLNTIRALRESGGRNKEEIKPQISEEADGQNNTSPVQADLRRGAGLMNVRRLCQLHTWNIRMELQYIFSISIR